MDYLLETFLKSLFNLFRLKKEVKVLEARVKAQSDLITLLKSRPTQQA